MAGGARNHAESEALAAGLLELCAAARTLFFATFPPRTLAGTSEQQLAPNYEENSIVSAAQKDAARVSADGQILQPRIHDVGCVERPAIATRNGLTAEVYRQDWPTTAPQVGQILYVSLRPSAISAWHLHRAQTDHIFCVQGALKLVIFDPRDDSPSRGLVDVRLLHSARPQLIVIPPNLWHGLQNLDPARDAAFINAFDRVYNHADPDEYRLPADSSEIPFSFAR
jgi:dTDP-4-dehydrorhamnose 3,5-epimerase